MYPWGTWDGVRRKEGALLCFLTGMARNGDHGEAIIDTAIIEILKQRLEHQHPKRRM